MWTEPETDQCTPSAEYPTPMSESARSPYVHVSDWSFQA